MRDTIDSRLLSERQANYIIVLSTPSDQDLSDNLSLSGLREQAERIVTVILSILLVLAIVGVVYIALMPPESGATFTEFYLLGPDGTASEYPTLLTANGSGTVIVGVSNHERKPTNYTVRVTWNGTQTIEQTLPLAAGETTEVPVNLTAPAQPGQYRVQFLLYNETSTEQYITTRLYIYVTDS